MGAEKSKLEGSEMEVHFEGDMRSFDADHPITGFIKINTN